jgi:hypothetical protein
MLVPEGIAVGSTDGVADVPPKPASCWPLPGVMAALAEVPLPPPHAASSSVPATAAPAAAARHRRIQRR